MKDGLWGTVETSDHPEHLGVPFPPRDKEHMKLLRRFLGPRGEERRAIIAAFAIVPLATLAAALFDRSGGGGSMSIIICLLMPAIFTLTPASYVLHAVRDELSEGKLNMLILAGFTIDEVVVSKKPPFITKCAVISWLFSTAIAGAMFPLPDKLLLVNAQMLGTLFVGPLYIFAATVAMEAAAGFSLRASSDFAAATLTYGYIALFVAYPLLVFFSDSFANIPATTIIIAVGFVVVFLASAFADGVYSSSYRRFAKKFFEEA